MPIQAVTDKSHCAHVKHLWSASCMVSNKLPDVIQETGLLVVIHKALMAQGPVIQEIVKA